MKKFIIALILIPLLGTGCGGSGATTGGSSFGNPSRSITGNTDANAEDSCPTDTIIATDSTGETVVADFADDCTFELELATDTAYVLSFALDGTFVATLIFTDGDGGVLTSVLFVDEGDDPIDLGLVTFADASASPANNPLEQNDRDDDGIDDFDDDDDDDDGVFDDDEEDCDEDDYEDDEDEEDSDCDAEDDGDSDEDADEDDAEEDEDEDD